MDPTNNNSQEKPSEMTYSQSEAAEKYRPLSLSLASQVTYDREEKEDLSQEMMAEVQKAVAKFRGEAPHSYCKQTMINVRNKSIKKVWRRRRRERLHPPEDISALITGSSEQVRSLSDIALDAYRLALMHAKWRDPVGYNCALRRYGYKETIREVAKANDLTRSQVYTKLKNFKEAALAFQKAIQTEAEGK